MEYIKITSCRQCPYRDSSYCGHLEVKYKHDEDIDIEDDVKNDTVPNNCPAAGECKTIVWEGD